QAAHMHGSPDGPWFFIVARSKPDEGASELIGITDTSMLRPQVFALFENEGAIESATNPAERGASSQRISESASRQAGESADRPTNPRVQIGLIASERQAINACLRSLASEDERFQPIADKYWVARGGSHTDGGSFRFAVSRGGGMSCVNKFGVPVALDAARRHVDRAALDVESARQEFKRETERRALRAFDDGGSPTLFEWASRALQSADWNEAAYLTGWLRGFAARGDAERAFALETLALLRDRRYDPGDKKRASLLAIVDEAIRSTLSDVSLLDERASESTSRAGFHTCPLRRLTRDTRTALRAPLPGESTLVIDTAGFPHEGEESAARWIVRAAEMGWRRFITFAWHGDRFAACGLGPGTDGMRLDLYGDVGDYAASGLDGAEVHIHGDAQDQVGQILKSGKLVIHGDVGQTFLYGAKGGEIYVLGSAAGRPLINAVGRPRAVINGTCLDYLAESFMAGDPHDGGGFVVLNGVAFDEAGQLVELESPYPGGNLFSLASGGAIFVRDPHRRVVDDQLNGGRLSELVEADWRLIEPYLRENERLFGIRVDDLLTVDGMKCDPCQVYRKVEVGGLEVLKETENR
ncbi:MAG TPA: glutamate synthase, partial [Anaerolineae bacterium]|nr:glutamate synthase [Anaerolineae bacterium]